MENNLLAADSLALKELFNEPLYLIKEDFKDSNVSNLEQNNTVSEIETSKFKLTGQNKKSIVFIMFSESTELSILEQDLYFKTIAALKLDKDDVAYSISSKDKSNSFDLISSQFPSQKVVCFGNTSIYKNDLLVPSDYQSTKILKCPSLQELSENNEIKMKWWTSLKAFLN